MLNSVDPLAMALLKSGGAGGVGAGPILVQPPEQKMRMMMAQQLLGADPASARTKGEGIARLGQQLLGAYLAKQGMDEAKTQRESDAGLMAAALRSQDKTPTTYTDDAGNQQTITWNKPDPSTMTTIMAQGSPQLQQQALAMALNDRQRQADIAAKTVTMLTPEQVKAAGLPPGAYQRDAYGKVDLIAKAPLFGMPGPGGGDAVGGAPAASPAGGGTMTVPKAPAATPTGPVPMSPQARATISVESGGNADATNPNSSATGPAQFIDSTWLSMMQKHAPGLIQGKSKDEILAMRSDPEVSAAMTDAYAKENDAALRSSGLEPTPQDLYLAHVFGPGGASTMLKADQRAPAANLNSRAVVEANRPLFFDKGGRPRTVAELRQLLGDRFNQNMPQETAGGMPVMQPPTAGVPMPQVMPPGTADTMPNPMAGAPPQPVQVAQASTGTMTDAAPAAVQPSAQQFRRPIDPESGKMLDFELPVGPNGDWPRLPDGRIDISKARPYEARTNTQKDYETAVSQGFNGTLLEYEERLKRAGKTDINFGDRATDQTVGKYIGEAWSGAIEGGKSARQDLANLDRMQSYLDQIKSGRIAPTTAAIDRWARGVGIDLGVNPQAPVAEALASLSNQMALKLRDPSGGAGMPGALSDSDRRFLTEMVPSLVNTPEGNQLMIDYTRRLAERRLEMEKIALDHIKRNKGQVTADVLQEMADYGNSHPLFGKADYERVASYGGGAAGGQPPTSAAPPPGARPAPPVDGQPSYTMPNGQTVIQGQPSAMPALPPGFQIVR